MKLELKQLESTLPPMKLDLSAPNNTPEKASSSPYSNLRTTKSYIESPRTKEDPRMSSLGAGKAETDSKSPNDLHSAPMDVSESSQATPDKTPQRLDLRSSASLPPALEYDHNAWLDEEEDFGQEKEVTMSFE